MTGTLLRAKAYQLIPNQDHASPSRSMDPENESLFNGFQSHYDGDEPLVENSEQLHNNGMETSTIISVGPNFPTTLNWSSGIDFEKSTHSTTPSESWRLETPGPSRSSSTTGNELRLRGWTSPDRLRSNLSYAADNSQQAQPSSENPLSIPARQDSHGYVLDPAITQLSEAPLEQRILHVVESARAAGFDCLDTMILQFYTESFGEDTPLFEIQHRSRRRGLETVLSQLSLQAQTWPQREAQTFEETILASMEQIVKREARDHKAARANADLNPSTPEATSHCTGSLRNQASLHSALLHFVCLVSKKLIVGAASYNLVNLIWNCSGVFVIRG